MTDYKKFCIEPCRTLREAMKQLDETSKKILFVTDGGKVTAALTDGDIRRFLLKGGTLDDSVYAAANKNPKLARCRDEALLMLKDLHYAAVPVVTDDWEIRDVVIADEHAAQNYTQLGLPVVIMAGGKGTRLYPYTKILPKPLIPIGDLPITEHIINQFREYGCRDFYLIVNHKKNMIKAYFNEIEHDYNIYYMDEERPLGTGGGLSLLKGRICNTFILTNCDILIQENFADIYCYHRRHQNVITMVCSLQNLQIPYGVVHIRDGGKIDSMEEKPSMSFLTNTGCYIVEPEVVESLPSDTPIGFPDIVERYLKEGRNVGVYPVSENAWLDMGQISELENMKKKMGD